MYNRNIKQVETKDLPIMTEDKLKCHASRNEIPTISYLAEDN